MQIGLRTDLRFRSWCLGMFRIPGFELPTEPRPPKHTLGPETLNQLTQAPSHTEPHLTHKKSTKPTHNPHLKPSHHCRFRPAHFTQYPAQPSAMFS